MRPESEGNSKYQDTFNPAKSSTLLTHSNSNKFAPMQDDPGARLQVSIASAAPSDLKDGQGPDETYGQLAMFTEAGHLFEGMQVGS